MGRQINHWSIAALQYMRSKILPAMKRNPHAAAQKDYDVCPERGTPD
jgi:hypothetical protein